MTRTSPALATPLLALVCLVNQTSAQFTDVTPDSLRTSGAYGAAWGDFDDDGDVDLYLTSNAANSLFRNDGNQELVNVAPGTPLADMAAGRAAPWGDYDGDGDLDLYVSNEFGGPNRLLRNDGAAGFVDATMGPLGDPDPSFSAIWGDYDLDGDLDLYLGKWGHTNRLFRNDGAAGFVDATAGPLHASSNSDLAAWGDHDSDGDLDLYLAVYIGGNRLLRNDLTAGFTDVTTGPLGHPGPTEGIDWGDYDHDGDLDLYFATEDGPGTLLRNDGDGEFEDVTNGPLGEETAYGVAWADFDHDGDLDLLVTPARLMRNDGNDSFVDVTSAQLPGAVATTGAAWGDHDQDGDLDLFLTSYECQLFRNDLAGNNHWLQVDLDGTVSNESGIGSRIRLVAGSRSQIREVSGGAGFCSQSAMSAHFGLGAATLVDTLEIRWSTGGVRTLTNLPADSRVPVREAIRVPADYPSIQAALDAATTGEKIVVAPGIYTGIGNRDLEFQGKTVKLESAGGPAVTRIDCEHQGRAFRFAGGESSGTLVRGFTVVGGAAADGGAMTCDASSPTLVDCIFSANTATNRGGAAYLSGSAAPTFIGCELTGNRAGLGGAIACQSASVMLGNCTLYMNAAGIGAGMALSAGSTGTIEQTIIAFGELGEAIACSEVGSVTSSCGDLFGNAGGDWVGGVAGQLGLNGNFSADPLFCDPALGDLSLHSDSPCAPVSSPGNCGLVGARPVNCSAAGIAPRSVPRAWSGLRAIPNPVLAATVINWHQVQAGNATCRLYDALGRLVAARDLGHRPGGQTGVSWGELIGGRQPAAGIYFLELESAGRRDATRLVLIR